MQVFSAPKTVGRKLSLVAAILAAATAIVYFTYESGMKAVDSAVIGILIGIVVCDVAYAFVRPKVPFDVMGIVQIGAAALSAWGLTSYLNDDIANLADLLNGVTIFSGGTGDVTTIFTIIGLLVALGVIQIVDCFLKSE